MITTLTYNRDLQEYSLTVDGIPATISAEKAAEVLKSWADRGGPINVGRHDFRYYIEWWPIDEEGW